MNIEQVVRDVTVRGRVQGMDQVASAYNNVSDAADRTATITDIATKAQISAAAAIEKMRLSYQDGYRQQQQYNNAQAAYQRAEEQGLITKKAAAAELANIQNKLGQATNAQKSFGVVTSDLNNRVQASAGAFGVAGAAMSALGPIGIGVAAVMGAVYLAINHMISEANRMGEGAVAMRAFAETTGFTITEIKTLGKAGAEFGVGTDAIASSVDKFTVNMEEARKGTGALFDAVRAIDGGLATELAATTKTAQAWDVLGKARAAASDQSKNALSKAAFGKGGIETGLVLDVTAQAGGLEALVAKQQKLNGLTDDQIKKWAVTKVQIEETQKRTANLMAATYTQEVLDRQLQAAQLEERITRALVDGNAQRQKRSYWDLFSAGVDTNPVTPRQAANSNLAAGLSSGQKPDLSGYDAMAKKLWEVVAAEKAEQDARKAAADAAARESNRMKEEIGYLGSAATANERLAQKLKELEAAKLTRAVSPEAYGRAVAAANLDTAIAKQSAYVSALGASAPIAELVRDKELQLQRQRQQDPRITKEIIEQQKALVASQQLGTFQIAAQTDAENVRIAALFKSNEAAISYVIVQTKINEARAKGAPLTKDQIGDLQKEANAFASLKVKGDLYVDLMSTARQSGASFTGDLISGLRDSKSGMEALSAAATNLSKSLAQGALNDLFNGNFAGAAIKGIAALGAAIVGNNTKTSGEKWLAEQTANMNQRLADYSARVTMIGVDTNTRAGAILAQDAEFTQQRIKENKDGGQVQNALLQLQVQERIQLLKDWDQKDIALVKANADAKLAIEKAANDRALGFQNRLFAATNDFSTLEGQLAAFDRAAAQEKLLEAANENNRLADLEAASAAERFKIIQDNNKKIVADAEATAKAQRDGLNSSVKSILDYITSITAGPSSNYSPQQKFDAAQSTYNAKLVLAQAGNVDALGSITTDFENYRQATLALFGSTAAGQQIIAAGIAQLLALPAVQATDDPVLVAMRNVLTAINAGNAVQATDATLIGTIKGAIDAGNAAQTATALSSYFNKIDTNTSQSIDFNEMVAALTPVVQNTNGTIDQAATTAALASMAGNSALRDMFTRLDTDNSGSIDRLELIKAASQATNSNTGSTATNTANTKAAVDAANALNNAIKVATEGMRQWGAAGVLDAIKGLQQTAADQLVLLQQALTPTSSATFSIAGSGPVTANNKMVDALNKIVINTYQIAANTNALRPASSTPGGLGVYASGGLVTGPGTGTSDSIRAMLSNREYVMPATRVEQFGVGFFDQLRNGILPTLPFNDNSRPVSFPTPSVVPFHGGGNDNAEIRALREQVELLTAAVKLMDENNVRATATGAEHIGERVDRVAAAAQETAREQKFALAS